MNRIDNRKEKSIYSTPSIDKLNVRETKSGTTADTKENGAKYIAT